MVWLLVFSCIMKHHISVSPQVVIVEAYGDTRLLDIGHTFGEQGYSVTKIVVKNSCLGVEQVRTQVYEQIGTMDSSVIISSEYVGWIVLNLLLTEPLPVRGAVFIDTPIAPPLSPQPVPVDCSAPFVAWWESGAPLDVTTSPVPLWFSFGSQASFASVEQIRPWIGEHSFYRRDIISLDWSSEEYSDKMQRKLVQWVAQQ